MMTGANSFSSSGGYLETAQMFGICADVAFGELVASSGMDYNCWDYSGKFLTKIINLL